GGWSTRTRSQWSAPTPGRSRHRHTPRVTPVSPSVLRLYTPWSHTPTLCTPVTALVCGVFPCATALWQTGASDGRIENREQTRLLLGHHIVPEGTDAADLDLHHVPRPHVRGGALRPQPDDVPRVERAVTADFRNMAGRVEEHVPGIELDL